MSDNEIKFRNITLGEPKESGRYLISESDEFDYVSPYHQIKDIYKYGTIAFYRHILMIKGFKGPNHILEKVLEKKADEDWQEQLCRYRSIKVHSNLIKLLETQKKKEQVKLLHGLALSREELISFVFKAFEEFGYFYSQYKASHNHEGLDCSLLPNLIHIEDSGEVIAIGETALTKGEQRQAVEHRKVIVAKFLDKGEVWHCFFLTYKSLSGKESYKNGQPHLHYISSAWNIPREEVRAQLKSKKYSLPTLPHIDYYI